VTCPDALIETTAMDAITQALRDVLYALESPLSSWEFAGIRGHPRALGAGLTISPEWNRNIAIVQCGSPHRVTWV